MNIYLTLLVKCRRKGEKLKESVARWETGKGVKRCRLTTISLKGSPEIVQDVQEMVRL